MNVMTVPWQARDVALFDQRGCLSVHAVLVQDSRNDGDAARHLAEVLAAELEMSAEALPPGPADAARSAAVRAVRDEADMAGLWTAPLARRRGTVLVDFRNPARLDSPGLRTVRVVPVASFEGLQTQLEPWRGRIQGVSVAGRIAESTLDFLRHLGVSRFAAAGELQATDAATWHNGGRAPLEIYAASPDEVSADA